MKKLIVSWAKKYIIKAINDLFEKNKDNTIAICNQIKIWTDKINVISAQLSKIAARCEDGQLDSQEVDDSISEVETIIKNWSI